MCGERRWQQRLHTLLLAQQRVHTLLLAQQRSSVQSSATCSEKLAAEEWRILFCHSSGLELLVYEALSY